MINFDKLEDEDIEAGRSLLTTLDNNVAVTKETLASVSSYRNAVRGLERQNPSRTLRIASKRLGEALDVILKTLRKYNSDSQGLKGVLAKKMPH